MLWFVNIGTLIFGFRVPYIPNTVLLSHDENEVLASSLFWSRPSLFLAALAFPKEANLCAVGTGRHHVRSQKKKQGRKAEIELFHMKCLWKKNMNSSFG